MEKQKHFEQNKWKVSIEFCKSCETHGWCTHHDEQKYRQAYLDLQNGLRAQIPELTIVGNEAPDYLTPIKAKQNKYYDTKNRKYMLFPAIGAFEVYLNENLIFSKKNTNAWPNNTIIIDQIYKIVKGVPRKSSSQVSVAKTQKVSISEKYEKQTVKRANSVLKTLDNNNTFYSVSPKNKMANKMTLTDHFKRYKMKQNDNDLQSLYAQSETNSKNGRISKITNQDIQKLHSIWGKKQNLPSFIKNKAFIEQKQGKKQMLVNLQSIQQQNQMKQVKMNIPKKKKNKISNLDIQFQKLQNKMLKFANRVSEVNNKKFQFDEIGAKDKILKKINKFSLVDKINQNKNSSFNPQKIVQNLRNHKKRRIQQYIHAPSEVKNQRLSQIYGPQFLKTVLSFSKVKKNLKKIRGTFNQKKQSQHSKSKNSQQADQTQYYEEQQEQQQEDQRQQQQQEQEQDQTSQQQKSQITEDFKSNQVKRQSSSVFTNKGLKKQYSHTQKHFNPQKRPLYSRGNLSSGKTNNIQSANFLKGFQNQKRQFQSRSLLQKLIPQKSQTKQSRLSQYQQDDQWKIRGIKQLDMAQKAKNLKRIKKIHKKSQEKQSQKKRQQLKQKQESKKFGKIYKNINVEQKSETGVTQKKLPQQQRLEMSSQHKQKNYKSPKRQQKYKKQSLQSSSSQDQKIQYNQSRKSQQQQNQHSPKQKKSIHHTKQNKTQKIQVSNQNQKQIKKNINPKNSSKQKKIKHKKQQNHAQEYLHPQQLIKPDPEIKIYKANKKQKQHKMKKIIKSRVKQEKMDEQYQLKQQETIQGPLDKKRNERQNSYIKRKQKQKKTPKQQHKQKQKVKSKQQKQQKKKDSKTQQNQRKSNTQQQQQQQYQNNLLSPSSTSSSQQSLASQRQSSSQKQYRNNQDQIGSQSQQQYQYNQQDSSQQQQLSCQESQEYQNREPRQDQNQQQQEEQQQEEEEEDKEQEQEQQIQNNKQANQLKQLRQSENSEYLQPQKQWMLQKQEQVQKSKLQHNNKQVKNDGSKQKQSQLLNLQKREQNCLKFQQDKPFNYQKQQQQQTDHDQQNQITNQATEQVQNISKQQKTQQPQNNVKKQSKFTKEKKPTQQKGVGDQQKQFDAVRQEKNVGTQSKPRRIYQIDEQTPQMIDIGVQKNPPKYQKQIQTLDNENQLKQHQLILQKKVKNQNVLRGIQNKQQEKQHVEHKQEPTEQIIPHKQPQVKKVQNNNSKNQNRIATVQSWQTQRQVKQIKPVKQVPYQNAAITKQFYGNQYNQKLKIKIQQVDNDDNKSESKYIKIGKIYREKGVLFDKESISPELLIDNSGILGNFCKVIKLLCSRNQFLIIRLFENPEVNQADSYGVWLCDNYTWRRFNISSKIQIDSKSEPTHIHHTGYQRWPAVLIEALAQLFNGYDELSRVQIPHLFHALTGSNFMTFKVKEDPEKNVKMLKFITINQKKNFIILAQKRLQNCFGDAAGYKNQPPIYYILSQKIINGNQVLLRMKKGDSDAFWIKLQKFVSQFSQVDILQLRVNHNFCILTLNNCSSGRFKVVELQFNQQSFGCVAVVADNNKNTDFKLFLYKEEDDNVLRLVGQVNQKNKKMTFFDCCFEQGKYLVFADIKNPVNKINYMGQNRPVMQIKQQVHEVGLRSNFTEYIPINSPAPSRKQSQMPKFLNMTRKNQSNSAINIEPNYPSRKNTNMNNVEMQSRMGMDKQKLKSQFVKYLLNN